MSDELLLSLFESMTSSQTGESYQNLLIQSTLRSILPQTNTGVASDKKFKERKKTLKWH